MKKRMTYDVEETPPIAKWIILAFQHVFAMFGATVLVPILVNTAAGAEVLTIPVALVASGIGTLIYILCTKGKSPVYLGSSFAFIAPIAVAYTKGGISGAMTGVMAVGLIYVIVATIIHFTGKAWLEKLLPPVVIGPMIMVIGLGLASSAISNIGIAAGQTFEWQNAVVALVSFLVTALFMTRAKGLWKVIPFLIGIVSGYILSACLGLVDFTKVVEAAWISVPNFQIPFVHYELNFAALITIAPIALVTMCEHIGDHTSLSNIIGRDLIKEPGLDRTLLGDGLATFVAGALGGPANTTYGENTAVVGITKVASVKVIGLAAIFAIILGFFGKFTALVQLIPAPVLGGVSILLYGFIAVNGLKVLIKNQVNFDDNKNVAVAAAMLVIGLGGATISIVNGDLDLAFSGMSLAAIVGILLNVIIPSDKEALQNELDWDIPSETEAAVNTIKKEVKKEVKKAVAKKAPAKKTTAKKTTKKK